MIISVFMIFVSDDDTEKMFGYKKHSEIKFSIALTEIAEEVAECVHKRKIAVDTTDVKVCFPDKRFILERPNEKGILCLPLPDTLVKTFWAYYYQKMNKLNE